MKKDSIDFNMNISNYLYFFFHDKWSLSGGLGAIFSFLISFTQINTTIATITAIVGLVIAILSAVKLYFQVKTAKVEYEKTIDEIDDEK